MKQQHFNRIRQIILNPNNKMVHSAAIRNMIENYERMFGLNHLTLKLRLLHTNFIFNETKFFDEYVNR